MSCCTAEIEYTEEENDREQLQDCVYATCDVGEITVGPIWGHSAASVARALATLTEECDCGAAFHAEA